MLGHSFKKTSFRHEEKGCAYQLTFDRCQVSKDTVVVVLGGVGYIGIVGGGCGAVG